MRKVTLEPYSRRAAIGAHLIDLCGGITHMLRSRGLYRVAEAVGRLMPDGCLCQVQVAEDCLYEFPLADPYWARLLHSGFQYEPEILRVLELVDELDYSFLDAGANFGYWSTIVSGRHRERAVVAVEALSLNFRFLRANCLINDARFAIVHAAVAREAGRTVSIEYPVGGPESRVGAGIRQETGDPLPAGIAIETNVNTVTLDSIWTEYLANAPTVVVKLDVEGAEIDALSGAANLLSADVLLLYEDHGGDRMSTVTEHILELGFTVLFVNDSGAVSRVSSSNGATALKALEHKGYNFVAFRAAGAFGGLLGV